MIVPSLQVSRAATLRLSFAPNPLSARAVSAAVRTFLAEHGVPAGELYSFELSIAEATYNAIDHATGSARELWPVAEALFSPEEIELRVIDHTAGFELPQRIAPPSPFCERGRGLFIIQSVMDEMSYLRGATENILIMRKRRSGVPAPSAEHAPSEALSRALEASQREAAESKRALAGMARELTLRTETLSAIFRCCAELGRGDELAGGFAQRLLADLLHLTAAEWYVLRLIDAEQRQLAVVAASDSGLTFAPLPLPSAGELPSGIEAAVAANQTAARFDMRTGHEGSEPLAALGPEATGFVCPLCVAGVLVGTIAVGRRNGDFPPGTLQDEVVRTFAEFLAIQTVNLRQRKVEQRNRVVTRELEIARDIQHLLLPRTLPQLAGFSLAGGWQSAREVGGDFYDVFALGGHSLILLIADVMGKGVPAALFATTMRGLLRGLAARSNDPAELLGALNRMLYAELSAVSMFITAQVVHVDLQTRQVTAAGAGHCPMLFVPPNRRTVSALPTQGIPIGVLPDTTYHRENVRLGTPAALFLHTDGLTDTRNATGKLFGQRRLMAWLRANLSHRRPASELRDGLMAELNRFRGSTPMTDDQAFLLLTEEGAPAARPATLTEPRIRLQRGAFLFPANT